MRVLAALRFAPFALLVLAGVAVGDETPPPPPEAGASVRLEAAGETPSAGVWARCLAFSPAGDVVAAGYSDGSLRLWDGTTLAPRAAFTLPRWFGPPP